MHPITLAGFHDELVKIAAPQSETPASKANAFFGLPLGLPRKKGTREYENPAAQTADRSQPGSQVMNPAPGATGT